MIRLPVALISVKEDTRPETSIACDASEPWKWSNERMAEWCEHKAEVWGGKTATAMMDIARRLRLRHGKGRTYEPAA